MESILQTIAPGLWWSKVGKWQALMTFVTLETFYITLYITRDVHAAAVVAAVVALAALLVAAAVVAAAFVALAALEACAAASLAALAAAGDFNTAVITAAVIIITVAVEKLAISRKAIRLSYAAEFILIFLSMLTTIMH